MVDIKAMKVAVNFLKSIMQQMDAYHARHMEDTKIIIGNFIGEEDRFFIIISGGIIERQLNIANEELLVSGYIEKEMAECIGSEILRKVKLLIYCAEKFIRDYEAISS